LRSNLMRVANAHTSHVPMGPRPFAGVNRARAKLQLPRNPQDEFTMKSKLLLIGLSLGCAACSSMPWNSQPKEVDRELVAAVPPGQSRGIDEARSNRDKASDARDVAKRNTAIAEDQLSLAKKEIEIAKAEQATAEAAVEIAQKGTTEDLEKANAALRDAKLVVASAETRIRWRELDVDRAKARVELAETKLVLADARVELARAEAVKELDRPAAMNVDVPAYEREVRVREKAVALAEIDVDAVENEAGIAHSNYLSSARAVPASYRKRAERIDEQIQFDTDGYKAKKIEKKN